MGTQGATALLRTKELETLPHTVTRRPLTGELETLPHTRRPLTGPRERLSGSCAQATGGPTGKYRPGPL